GDRLRRQPPVQLCLLTVRLVPEQCLERRIAPRQPTRVPQPLQLVQLRPILGMEQPQRLVAPPPPEQLCRRAVPRPPLCLWRAVLDRNPVPAQPPNSTALPRPTPSEFAEPGCIWGRDASSGVDKQ